MIRSKWFYIAAFAFCVAAVFVIKLVTEPKPIASRSTFYFADSGVKLTLSDSLLVPGRHYYNCRTRTFTESDSEMGTIYAYAFRMNPYACGVTRS